jgi:drug/metabolite transporter (DMT)-like permease
MLVLIAATLFSAAFSLIVRDAQLRGRNLWAVGAVNYMTAATIHLARWGLSPVSPISPTTLLLGAFGGLVYSGSYLLLFRFMQTRGVSVATAILRLSVIIPVALSILAWGERPDAMQAWGAGVALVALPLLAYRRSTAQAGQRLPLDRRGLVLLVTLFVGNGLCATTVRAFHQTGAPEQGALFLGTLFATAAVVTLVAWQGHRQGTTRADIGPGVALGLCNALSNLALVAALAQLSGVLVFPFQSAMGLVMVALFARAVWRERILRTESWGMVLAVAAVVLINLG